MECPLTDKLHVVGQAWSMQVLFAIAQGAASFTEIKKALPATAKGISAALKRLQMHGFVEKNQVYQLTAAGKQALTLNLSGIAQKSALCDYCGLARCPVRNV